MSNDPRRDLEAAARAIVALRNDEMVVELWGTSYAAAIDTVRDALAALDAERVRADAAIAQRRAQRVPRLLSCIEQWPDCRTGEYDPHCCRFPKSCSCTVYDLDYVAADALETLED